MSSENSHTKLHGFRKRIFRVLVEIVSVVFAVLVALAVDELRQDHAERQQAEAAKVAVLAELRANMDELRRNGPSLDSTEAHLIAIVDSAKDGQTPRGTTFLLSLPDFSDAAWKTAQMTRATAHLPLEWLIRVSKVYETQNLYQQVRADVVRSVGGLGVGLPGGSLAPLAGKIHVLNDIGDQLDAKYDSVLARGDVGASGADTSARPTDIDTSRADAASRPRGTR